MKNKPNVPDEISFGKEEYSWRMDWRVNGWMFAAFFISSVSDVFFPDQIKTWRVAGRAIIEIAPFVFLLFWARDLTHWIRGMDELHRRITQAAILFAVSATLFVVALWHVLAGAGVCQPVALHLFDPNSVWVILWLMTFFYFLGYSIFNRRYK